MSTNRSAALALGWTTLALTGLVEPMVGRGRHLALYHWDGRTSALFGPVLLVFALVWAAVFALLLSAYRAGRWRVAVWGALILLLPWLLANAADQLFHPIAWLRVVTFGLATVMLLGLLAAWRPAFEPRLERAWERASTVLLLLAFSGALCLAQLLWFWWSARALNRPAHASEVASVPDPPGTGRVIWIVFDELSYRQLYEHRFPGLRMPAFDALAAQSVVWTHVVPAGSKTDLVLPALLMGRPVEAIRASASGQLFFRESKDAAWSEFPQHDTVFQDALNAGDRTGVAGWYNPYCRIMPAVLDQCFWRMYTELDNGLGSDETFASNVRMAVAAMEAGGLHDPAMTGSDFMPEEHLGAKGHLDDYTQLLAQSERLLADPSLKFVLLHLPVPHPGGIFNRATGQFALGGTSYVDNLALADRCLGQLRAQLERTGVWDEATVVLMGDHSWRTDTMWRRTPAQWTPEDEAASEGGKFDDRPAYMVKLPNEHTGLRIDTPFAALNTRQLLDQLIVGKLKTPAQLAQWVEQAGSRR